MMMGRVSLFLLHILCFHSSLSTRFLTFFCFADSDAEEDEVSTRTPTRTPTKTTKGGRPPSSAKKKNLSSNKARAKKKADVDSGDEEEEEFGMHFHYKDGEEAYADRIIPVCSNRGQAHLNDPVDYIAKLDQGVRMKHEGGT
jgi:hypothetical protein